MEKEIFLSGYCHSIDCSRMVAVVTEDGRLEEVDCCYPDCIHAPDCTIARQIPELLES